MFALGLSVALPTPSRPVIRAVLLEDPFDSTRIPSLAEVSVVEEFELTTAETDWARICSQYSQDISARVSTLSPTIVIVRRADFHKSGKPTDGLRLRLVVEGAISAAAMGHVANTHLRTGVQCAAAYTQDKAALDSDGRTLVSKTPRTEAAAAALSGLVGNRV